MKVHFVKTSDISEKIGKLFNEERKKLLDLFPYAEIEHIGATAIPGTISKGDLDINIRVKPENFPKVIEVLKTEYDINQPENWTASFASFKDDNRDLGIQVTVMNGPEDIFVKQRDYLLRHPELVSELNNLKKSFEGKDMDGYRKAKEIFFNKINIK